MKEFITLTLALILVFSVCACSNETPSGNLPTDTLAETEADTTAPETAPETEAETEFIPTDDNVIWGIADFEYDADTWGIGEMAHLLSPCGSGKIYIQSDVLEAMKTSGDKRIAVEYYYRDGAGENAGYYYPPCPLPVEIPQEYVVGKGLSLTENPMNVTIRMCFLTADEIVDLILAVEGRQIEYPLAQLSIISFSKYCYETGQKDYATDEEYEEAGIGLYARDPFAS